MNIIRTSAVELSSIPAIAYKQKLSAGGSGLKLYRLDQDAQAVFTIDRRTGGALPFGKVDVRLFPDFAIEEALELTVGAPYSARGKVKITGFDTPKEPEDVEETETEAIDMVGSDEYVAIVDRYTDDRGKMNYRLMNKDFIQFAAKSKTIADMVGKRALEQDILIHILKNRASFLAGKKDSLSDAEVLQLIETLDEIDPRSTFKELKNHIRRMLA